MKKKYIALGLCVVLSLSACGGQKATQAPQEPDQKVVQQTEPAPDLVQVKAETPIEPENTTGENAVDEAAPVEEAGPVEEVEAVGEVELFTSCEEIVYATGEVNIRASWTSSSDKLGSLARGDSVTRTGNSITGTEAENWSRVQLQDGSTAYINNNYLSLTKPATQQATTGSSSGSSSKTTQQTQQTTQQQAPQVTQQTPAQPASEGSVVRPDCLPDVEFRKDGLTDEERQRQREASSAILNGEAQLQYNEEGGYYYYEY